VHHNAAHHTVENSLKMGMQAIKTMVTDTLMTTAAALFAAEVVQSHREDMEDI
jgi:L-amino acid N-acyltransferase YncA